MPLLDYSIPEFEFLVGAFDATDYLDSLRLREAPADYAKSLTYSGQFELSYNDKARAAGLTPDDFDPLTTPGLWRPAQVPVVFSVRGYPLRTFRIKRYIFNPQTNIGQGELEQILDTVEGDRPAEEVELTIGQSGDNLTQVATKLLEAGYSGAAIVPTIAIGQLTGSLDARVISRDPIRDAQSMVLTNYRWLWCDSAEVIRSVSGDPAQNAVLFTRSLGEVEWEPSLDNLNFAAEKIIVTGERQKPAPSSLKVNIINRPEEVTHDDEGRPLKITTYEYAYKADVFSNVDGLRDASGRRLDTSKIVREEKTIFYRYWGINTEFEPLPPIDQEELEYSPTAGPRLAQQLSSFFPALETLGYQVGDRVETVIEYRRTLGEMFPDDRPGDTGLFLYKREVQRDYAKWAYLARGVSQPEAYPTDTSLDLTSAEPIAAGRVNGDGVIQNQKDPRTGGPLQLETRYRKQFTMTKADLPLVTESLKGECNLEPIGWTPFRRKPLVESFGFLPSEEHAANLARQIGLAEIRERDAINITMPIPIEWLAAGAPPLHRCQVYNAELQIKQTVIILDGDSLTFSFTGGKVGTIPTIPDLPLPAPYIPSEIGLAIVPPPSIRAIVDSPITPAYLRIYGGSTWSADDTLPPGLSLSPTGELAGTPTTVTPGAWYTVRVTSGARTATAEIWIEVRAIASPVLPVAEVRAVTTGLTVGMLVTITERAPYRLGVVPGMEVSVADRVNAGTMPVSVGMQVTITTGGGGGGGY